MNDQGKNTRANGLQEPADMEAERAVLGSCLLDATGEAIGKTLEVMQPGDFYDWRHRTMFVAMQEVARSGTPIDAIVVSDVLRRDHVLDKVGGLSGLVGLATAVPSAANVGYYADIVQKKAQVRAVRDAARRILAESDRPGVEAEQLMRFSQSEILGLKQNPKSRIMTAAEWTSRHFNTLNERQQHQSRPHLITGNRGVDHSGMLRRGGMTVVGGRPGCGKSAWIMEMAVGVAENNQHAIVVEVEMPEEMTADRLVAHHGSVDTRTLERADTMTISEWSDANAALTKLSQLPLDLWIVARIHINDLITTLMNYHRIRPLAFVGIDYIQLVHGDKGVSREQEVSQVSWALAEFAKDTNTCVVAGAQLNRALEQRTDKRPMLSDLRESGSIEQDATVVQFLYRPALYDGRQYEAVERDIEALIAKFRGGPIGSFTMTFEKAYQRFSFNP